MGERIVFACCFSAIVLAQRPNNGGGGGGTSSSGATTCTTSATTCSSDGSQVAASLRYNSQTGVFSGFVVTNQCFDSSRGGVYNGVSSGLSVTPSCSNQTFPAPAYSTTPAAAPLRGRIGLSLGGSNIYGPFDAGFTAGQACTVTAGTCDAGTDVTMCEALLEYTCGTANLKSTMFMDDCGGHASPYHYHCHGKCWAQSDTGHSPLVALMLDGRGLYGANETTGQVPTDLDACGGHFGPVPATTYKGVTYPAANNVYHYHVQAQPPYFAGCFGPVSSLTDAKSLYPTCTTSVTTINVCTSIGMYSNYVLDCPVFRMGNESANQVTVTSSCPVCKGNCPATYNVSPTPSRTRTPAPTVTSSASPTPLQAASASATPTPTPTSSATRTPSQAASASATPTPTPTSSATRTPSQPASASATPTPTPSSSASPTPSSTRMPASPSPSSAIVPPSVTPTPTPSLSRSPSTTPSQRPSRSSTPTPSTLARIAITLPTLPALPTLNSSDCSLSNVNTFLSLTTPILANLTAIERTIDTISPAVLADSLATTEAAALTVIANYRTYINSSRKAIAESFQRQLASCAGQEIKTTTSVQVTLGGLTMSTARSPAVLCRMRLFIASVSNVPISSVTVSGIVDAVTGVLTPITAQEPGNSGNCSGVQNTTTTGGRTRLLQNSGVRMATDVTVSVPMSALARGDPSAVSTVTQQLSAASNLGTTVQAAFAPGASASDGDSIDALVADIQTATGVVVTVQGATAATAAAVQTSPAQPSASPLATSTGGGGGGSSVNVGAVVGGVVGGVVGAALVVVAIGAVMRASAASTAVTRTPAAPTIVPVPAPVPAHIEGTSPMYAHALPSNAAVQQRASMTPMGTPV